MIAERYDGLDWEALGLTPRAFSTWKHSRGGTDRPLPCVAPEPTWNYWKTQWQPTRQGIFFVKNLKAGSSSGASVTLRMAHQLAKRQRQNNNNNNGSSSSSTFPICRNRVHHPNKHAATMRYNERQREHSFLWSIVRDPTTRATSQFFHFHVSRQNWSSSDASFQHFLQLGNHWMRDFQINYLRLHHASFYYDEDAPSSAAVVRAIQEILDEYDFLAVTERMDESIVALQMILGLDSSDVLFLT